MKRCLSFVVLALVLALPAAAGATTFGAGVQGDFFNQVTGAWSPAQTMNSLNALHAAGGQVGRADSDWAGAEPRGPVHGHHTYNWAYDDLLVGEMAQAHLRWQPSFEFAPRWAQAHRSNVLRLSTGPIVVPLPPASNASFASYATAFMHRYGAHGSFWAVNRSLPYMPVNTVEVWNEPDNTHNWGPIINLQDYAKAYEAVRAAVKRVNRSTQVVTGGLAWTQSSLPRLLKAFKGKPIDAVAVHPYAATPAGTIALVRYAMAQMRNYHRGSTPLLVNEYGWTSVRNTWGTTSARNVSSYDYQALVGLAKLHVAAIEPFEWAEPTWGLSGGAFARGVAAAHSRR